MPRAILVILDGLRRDLVTRQTTPRLAAFAEEHERAGFVAPRLLNPDGTLQPSVRAFPTPWRIATEYLFLRKLAPRSRARSSNRRAAMAPCTRWRARSCSSRAW